MKVQKKEIKKNWNFAGSPNPAITNIPFEEWFKFMRLMNLPLSFQTCYSLHGSYNRIREFMDVLRFFLFQFKKNIFIFCIAWLSKIISYEQSFYNNELQIPFIFQILMIIFHHTKHLSVLLKIKKNNKNKKS